MKKVRDETGMFGSGYYRCHEVFVAAVQGMMTVRKWVKKKSCSEEAGCLCPSLNARAAAVS